MLYVCDGVNDLKCSSFVDVSMAISDARDGIKSVMDIVSVKGKLDDI